MRGLKLSLLIAAIALSLGLLAPPVLSLAASKSTKTAASSKDDSKAQLEAVAQAYKADNSVQIGMIVNLDSKDSQKVVPATVATASKIQGVVVAPNDVPVGLSPVDASGGQVYVAGFGTYNVLVTNQNGPLKIGDYVTISSLNGVGMKATGAETEVIGKAAGEFTGTKNVIGTAKLKDETGKQVEVSIGMIPVHIQVQYNPLHVESQSNIPGFLLRAAELVAGKTVSATRIYISTFIVFMASVVSASLVYSGVRNGFVAVGRNPLAKKSVTRNILRVVSMSVMVFAIGLVAVYLLLKL